VQKPFFGAVEGKKTQFATGGEGPSITTHPSRQRALQKEKEEVTSSQKENSPTKGKGRMHVKWTLRTLSTPVLHDREKKEIEIKENPRPSHLRVRKQNGKILLKKEMRERGSRQKRCDA